MAIISNNAASVPVSQQDTSTQPKPSSVGKRAKKASSTSPGTPASPSPVKHLDPNSLVDDAEEGLRPRQITEYIGQSELKKILGIAIAAAKSRSEPLEHLLLYGPPGLGKTTMSLILAQEMGSACKLASAPALERPRDIVGLLMNLQEGDVLFIDEIHRLNRVSEELLYPAMEDFRLDVTVGQGQSARTRSISLPKFTLVGATTKIGAISAPLRDRFGHVHRLRFYEVAELTEIVIRACRLMNLNLTEAAAIEVAQRSRGTPRIANRLVKRVRDFAQTRPVVDPIVSADLTAEALEMIGVDSSGLDWVDRKLLSLLLNSGGPAGLETIAAMLGEDSQTIEDVHEPYLLQLGMLQRTPRGRIATELAREHLATQTP